MPTFMPGLRLSELFYREAVKPILDREFPHLVYAAALVGYGSEVLGYDTARSTDHAWGPRCWLFLPDADHALYQPQIDQALRTQLPPAFRDWPTSFTRGAAGLPQLAAVTAGPVVHLVVISALPEFFLRELGFDPSVAVETVDWLTTPAQKLLEMTRGAVFHDRFGVLRAGRERLAYYPEEIWRALLAAQWRRIGQEEAFLGRCGEAGDDLGSAIVAARLARDLMRLCCLQERQYAPYSKWLGTAFSRLARGPTLTPLLAQVLGAGDWQTRERYLTPVYEAVAARQNALGLTAPLDPRVAPFHTRPFLVIHADRFADALRATLTDDLLRTVVAEIGAIDQFMDSTDMTT